MKENIENSKISESSQSQEMSSKKSKSRSSAGKTSSERSSKTQKESEKKMSIGNIQPQNIPKNENSRNNIISNDLRDSQENRKSNSLSNNTKNLSIIIDKLETEYKNLQGDVRSATFKKILNNQDVLEILKELSRKNLEDIVVYILNEFPIDPKKDGISGNLGTDGNEKDKSFKDLFFLAIKKGQIHILEALDKQDINYTDLLDDEGNTGLILAVIYSNIQIAKFFLKNSPEMLDIKNNRGFTPLLLSVYNNDNLMFLLLANNL